MSESSGVRVVAGLVSESLPVLPVARRPVLPSLTGARWWAAFAVFILHALVFLPVYPFQKSELFRRIHQQFLPMQLGAAGVTFFFVLSGFIIYWSFLPGSSVVRYCWRRILKIYPTHFAAMALFILAASVPLSRFVVWVPNLFLIHTWVPRWSMLGGLNVPAWSLCAEIVFYLTFPLFLPAVRRVRQERLLGWAGVILLFIAALHLAFHLWAPGPQGTENAFAPRLQPGDTSPEFELHASPLWFVQPEIPISPAYWLSYYFPLARLPEFYLGVLAARMVEAGRWRTTRLRLPLTALVLAYVATWFVPVSFKMSVLMLAPMTAVIATLAAKDLRGVPSVNASALMVWLGNISFAFYLVQFPVMVVITRFLIAGGSYGGIGWLGWSTLCLVVAMSIGAAVYRWLDEPLMRRFAGRRQVRNPASDAGARLAPIVVLDIQSRGGAAR